VQDYHYQIGHRRAALLGAPPADRRRAARRLLSTGRATLAAVSEAWYGGDAAAARQEIYAGRSGARLATAPVAAVQL
jgi:hypothetical protein